MADEDILCVGICLPDEDEAYCIGCGRPWGTSTVPAKTTRPEPDVSNPLNPPDVPKLPDAPDVSESA